MAPRPAALAGIFLIALILRLIHVWQLRQSPFFDVLLGDARGYDEWAQRIASGDWIGHDVFYQAPLYPYFLGLVYAAVGHHLLAVRIIQAFVGSGSCVLLALAGRRFFSERVGLIAGVALALFAPSIFFDGLLQKSVLDVFFLTLALWIASRLLDERDRMPLWLALGLAMGALSLTRENALVFIAVIVIWALAAPRQDADARQAAMTIGGRARMVAVFVAGLALVLVPVAARNAYVGGGFYLTTSQFGPNFYIGNNPRADGTYMSLRFGRGAPEYERQDATELAEHALGRALTPSEVSNYWTDRALDFITHQPAAWLRLEARKMLLLWNAREMLDTESLESYAEWSWPLRLLAPFTHFGVIVPLAVAGLMIAWNDRSRVALLVMLLAAYAASVLLFYVFARYRLPLIPLLLLFAAVALAQLPALAAAARPPGFWTPRTLAALVTIAVLAVLANWPLLSPRLMQAITETNLATALDAAGRRDEALAHFQRAVDLEPQYAPAYNNLGVVQRAQGALDASVATYRRALAIQPDYPDAHYNLANALLAQNKPKEAQEQFEIALRSIPDSANVRNNLGLALSAQGNTDGAIAAFQAAVDADPRSARAQRNLALALSDAGRTDDAVAAMRRAIAIDGRDAGMHYDLGSILLEAGRLDDAIAEFRLAVSLEPRMAKAHNNLGIALAQKGDLAAAIASFEHALVIDPAFTDAQRNLQMARGALTAPAPRR